jgi:UDP-2,3-diacylglucosamine pyrophosphatase LpxH
MNDDAPVLNPETGKSKLRFKTIFISDVHLGMPDSKAAQASHFIRHCLCDKLVLNGDIIDAWHLRRLGGWNKSHTNFIRTVLRKMEKESTEIIYLRGNHDDVLDRFIPIQFEHFVITDEHIHRTPSGNYLVVHGDGFDAVSTNHAWLARLGGFGYNFLLRINRLYNGYRLFRGKEPFSFSAWVKQKVKSAVGAVGKYEEQLQNLAKQRHCKGIICGHIHKADNKLIGETHYLNSGDWVESMTAIVENLDGSFQIIGYPEFCQRTHRDPKGAASDPDEGAEETPPAESSAIAM